MTKRFGRNQKRAMRAQIATADALAAQRLQMAEYSRREAKYVRDELDEAKDIAGAMSMIFPATNTIDGGIKKPFMSIAEESRASLQDCIDNPMATLRVFDLPTLIASIEPESLSSAMHVMVQFGAGSWGYGLTWNAIKAMPERELCRRIAMHLAPIIAAELKKVRR